MTPRFKNETLDTDASASAQARIMDVAERLFASESYAAVSVRHITAAAGVNLAAINYYFGSKGGLLKAVYLRRVNDLNRERIHALNNLIGQASGGPLALEDVLGALLEPPIRWLFTEQGGLSVFVQFLARAQLEGNPELKMLFEQEVGHLRRFLPALCQAVPGLDDARAAWHLHFTLGSMHFVINHLERLRVMLHGGREVDSAKAVLDHLIRHSAAGFRSSLKPV